LTIFFFRVFKECDFFYFVVLFIEILNECIFIVVNQFQSVNALISLTNCQFWCLTHLFILAFVTKFLFITSWDIRLSWELECLFIHWNIIFRVFTFTVTVEELTSSYWALFRINISEFVWNDIILWGFFLFLLISKFVICSSSRSWKCALTHWSLPYFDVIIL